MKSLARNSRSQSVEDLAEVIELQHEVSNYPRTVEALMTLVCDRTQALTRAAGVTVEMIEGDEMVYRACTGSLSASLGLRLKVDASLSGLCVRTGEVLYCEDAEVDERVNREACRKVGARSMICVPLKHQQQNVGVLKVASPEAKAFSDREITLLRLTAGVLSSSIAQMTSRKSLEESELKFRTLIDTAADGILVAENGIAIEANPAFYQLFGYDLTEVTGRSIFDFVAPSDRARIEDYVRSENGLRIEALCLRKDRSTFYVEANGRTVNLAGKRVRVTTIRDITERKVLDATLRESEYRARQADRAKTTFLANMSHEIRTPLNGIMGMTQLFSFTKLSAEQREYIEVIQTSSETLLALVNDILDLSKIEAQKMMLETIEFDFNRVVEGVYTAMDFAAKKKQLELRCDLAPELNLELKGDPTRIRQILLNLVNNAIKFTAQGSVTIQTRVMKASANRVRFRVSVLDTGIGIKLETLPKLFKPFSQADASTTREYGGTGLGLSICKSLVNAMDGEIGVENREQGGAKFWFELELESQTAPTVSHSAPNSSCASGSARILVAEDMDVNVKVIRAMLSRMGHHAVFVGTGVDALKALRAQNFDVVLMDCQMPDMDGYEATRQIRASQAVWARIPVLALTANAMKDDVARCLEVGMNDHIAKPVIYEHLAEILGRWIAQTKTVAS